MGLFSKLKKGFKRAAKNVGKGVGKLTGGKAGKLLVKAASPLADATKAAAGAIGSPKPMITVGMDRNKALRAKLGLGDVGAIKGPDASGGIAGGVNPGRPAVDAAALDPAELEKKRKAALAGATLLG